MQLKRANFGQLQLIELSPGHREYVAQGPFRQVSDLAEFRLIRLDDCPAVFAAGFPRPDTARASWQTDWRLVGGRGLTEADAIDGCLGELCERACLVSRGGDDPLVTDAEATHPANAFLKFSARQQAALVDRHPALRAALKIGDIDWSRMSRRSVHAECLADSRIGAVSSICILLKEERFFGVESEQLGSSAGAAAHPDREAAVLNALFELAEHDAVGIWWYNQLPARRVPLEALAVASPSTSDLAAWVAQRDRQTLLLRLPTDLPVYVTAAISADRDGGWTAYGFSAHLSAESSTTGAVLEMLQCEISLSAMARRVEAMPPDAQDIPALLEWSHRLTLDAVARIDKDEKTRDPDCEQAVAKQSFLDAVTDHDVWIANVERPEFGVPAVRAVSGSLRDRSPRFAPGRLYTLPKELGFLDITPLEHHLNSDILLV